MVKPLIDVVTLKDGQSLLLNRYFLQLYDEFFNKLMLDHQDLDITVIFSEGDYGQLLEFAQKVNNFHLSCSYKTQVDTNSDIVDIVDIEPNVNEISTDQKVEIDNVEIEAENKSLKANANNSNIDLEKVINQSPIKDNEINDSKNMEDNTPDNNKKIPDTDFHDQFKCMFKCDSQDQMYSADDIFAHIHTQHSEEVTNIHLISLRRLLDKIASKINRKCIHGCLNNRVYGDKNRLKEH